MGVSHPACLLTVVPGLQRCTSSSLQCVCVCGTCTWVELLADSNDGSLRLECFFRTRHAGYLQIASRASRVRLMSRICDARVCMGCMERSNSSQRAISVYMPFILMSTDSPRLSTESL